MLGSFFSCFPVSGSLSRSVIQESIARTQVNKYNVQLSLIISEFLEALLLSYCLFLFANLLTFLLELFIPIQLLTN